MKTEQIMVALATHFSAPAWAFLPQVPDGTGSAKSRTADALAMSVWPSRGLELHGVEVKAFRGDWLRELKNPAKADAIFRFCDRWWIAAPEGVVAESELPETWGLLLVDARRVRTKVQAAKLTPEPMDTPMLAAILRRAASVIVPKDSIAEQLRDEYNRGFAAGKKAADAHVKAAEEREQKLHAAIGEFEGKSGIRIDSWSAGKMGAVVRMLLDDPTDQIRNNIEHVHGRITDLCEQISKALSEWPTDCRAPKEGCIDAH